MGSTRALTGCAGRSRWSETTARWGHAGHPFYLALWGIKYLDITRTYSQFKEDAAGGNLPAVSFLDPRYTVLDDGSAQ